MMIRVSGSILGLGYLVFIIFVFAGAREDDVLCLRGFKSAIQDHQQKLDWTFSNTTVGYICRFTGVTCWNERENRIVNLQLPSMDLGGTIPSSLQYCESITSLDLSDNSLSGPIPSNVCNWLPYLVHLDLSHNKFSGHIPPDLCNCKFLNTLLLDGNSLSGSIPFQLSRLNRLKRFSVANNRLSGPIPPFLFSFNPADFSGNSRLCGGPLKSSCRPSRKSLIIIINAGVFSAGFSLLLGFAFCRWCFILPKRHSKRDESVGWVKMLRAHRLVPVSLYKKPIVKLKVGDLVVATNGFDPSNVIASNRTGTSYKAVLRDGSALMIKRLHACKLSEKQFQSEMNNLSHLRHPNLVPLLGYCVVQNEKLLIYKHMFSGTLSSLLRCNASSCPLDWPSRRRISVGIARGLAWLHHGFQPPVLHQNISSGAILLDEEYEARISDFGLVQLMGPVGATATAFIHGDFGDLGYVAPEYASAPRSASLKGDVYGFGVILMELVSGQGPLEVDNVDERFRGSLVEWVTHLSSVGRIKDVVEKSLLGRGHDEEIFQVLNVAMGCVASRPNDRYSMYQAYQILKSLGGDDSSEHIDEFPLVFGRNDTVIRV